MFMKDIQRNREVRVERMREERRRDRDNEGGEKKR